MKATQSDGEKIECPSCGEIMRDLCDWDWRTECIETECDHCEAPLTLTRIVSVDYVAETREDRS